MAVTVGASTAVVRGRILSVRDSVLDPVQLPTSEVPPGLQPARGARQADIVRFIPHSWLKGNGGSRPFEFIWLCGPEPDGYAIGLYPHTFDRDWIVCLGRMRPSADNHSRKTSRWAVSCGKSPYDVVSLLLVDEDPTLAALIESEARRQRNSSLIAGADLIVVASLLPRSVQSALYSSTPTPPGYANPPDLFAVEQSVGGEAESKRIGVYVLPLLSLEKEELESHWLLFLRRVAPGIYETLGARGGMRRIGVSGSVEGFASPIDSVLHQIRRSR
ncbi:MAG: hypothetical protein ACREOU_06305 [Candidatus Eiseniibacteriota bacterium]